MILVDGVYDVLKWIALVVIPALAVAYKALAAIWGWPFSEEISMTANIICTLIGTIIGISQYNLGKKDE